MLRIRHSYITIDWSLGPDTYLTVFGSFFSTILLLIFIARLRDNLDNSIRNTKLSIAKHQIN